MKRKLFYVCFAVVLITAYLLTRKENIAKTADFAVELENQTAKKGEDITFYVTVKSSIDIRKIEAYLEYDSNYLEFVSAREEAVVGASGTLYIAEEFDVSVMETEYAITMKALEVGETKISIDHIYLEDDTNSDIIEINKTSATVKIEENKAQRRDASLSELLVFPGELNQEFRPDQTEYEVSVENDVEELILSAIPSMEESVVTIDQPDTLQVGTNKIVITVTAQSGSEKEYTLIVNRAKE